MTSVAESEYYLLAGNPLHPVYEVDRAKKEVRLVASSIGVIKGAIYPLEDRPLPDSFQRVRLIAEEDGVVRFAPYQEAVKQGEK